MTAHSAALRARVASALTGPLRDRIARTLTGPGRDRILQVLITAAVCLLMVTAGEGLTTTWTAPAAALIVIGAGVLMVIDARLAVYAFAIFLFAYEEFNLSSTEAFYGDTITTVLGVRILGLSIMDFLSVFLLAPVLLREWWRAMLDGRVRMLRADVLLLPLVLLWIYGAVMGLFHMETPSTYTWELRDLGHVFMFYFIFSRTLERPRDIGMFLLIGGATFVLKNSVFIGRWMQGGGLVTGGDYTRILLGSDLTLTAFFLCMTVAAQMILRGIPRITRIALGFLSIYFTVMLLAGLGRLTYLLTAAGIVMIFALNRRHVRTRTVVTTLAVGALGGVVFYFTALDETSRQTISYALASAFSWKDAIVLYGDLSLGTRVLEIINIWQTLANAGAVLWGLGWGSPWREFVPMPFDLGSFSIVDQMRGVHTQAHIDAVQFMLKVGLAGTIILYGALYRIWRRGVRLYHEQRTITDRFILIAVLVLLVVIVPNYLYFIRLKFLLGFAIAGIAGFMQVEGNGGEK